MLLHSVVVILLFAGPNVFATNFGWWKMDFNDDTAFDAVRNDQIFLRALHGDDGSVQSCFEYKLMESNGNASVETKSNSFCYPSVMITGMRKCSTSAMFNFLALSPHIYSLNIKENCPFMGQRSIIQYFDSLPKYGQLQGKYFVDGCVDLRGNMQMRAILRNPNTFYIVLVRDFSDWVWSAYNYWCDTSYESCKNGDWTIPGVHSRSPRLFHDIVMGALNGTTVPSPLHFKNVCEKGSNLFQQYLSSLWQHVPKEATYVIASEDFSENYVNIWMTLARKMGLPAVHPKLLEFHNYRYNTQLRKGPDAAVPSDSVRPGLYEVSDMLPLWNSTRKILDMCWKQDCLWLANHINYGYSACVNVKKVDSLNSANRVIAVLNSAPVPSRPAHGEVSEASFHGYLNRKLKSCQLDYSLRHRATEAFRGTSSVLDNQQLVVVSALEVDRRFIIKLLTYGMGLSEHQTYDVEISESKRCNTAKIIGVPLGMLEPAVPVSSTQQKRTPTQKRKKRNSAVLPESMPSLRIANHSSCSEAKISKVVLVLRDTMTTLWAQYRRHHLMNIDNAAIRFVGVNFTHWEGEAVQSLAASLTTNGEHDPLHLFSNLSNLFPSVGAHNVLQVYQTDFSDSESKLKSLSDLISFASRGTRFERSLLGELSTHDVIQQNSSTLQCTFMLASWNSSWRMYYDDESTGLDYAYSSDSFVCNLMDIAAKPSPPSTVSATMLSRQVDCQHPNSQQSVDRTCQYRYNSLSYKQSIVGHPVALLMSPGNAAVNMRLLIEHSTGYHSGSIHTNQSLLTTFQGEHTCGRRLSVVYASPDDVIIKRTRTGTATVSLYRAALTRCMKGMIRGFDKALVIITDPFVAIWRRYLSSRKLDRLSLISGKSKVSAVDFKAQIFTLAANYEPELQFENKEAFTNLVSMFSDKDALIVSYESIMFPLAQRLQRLANVMSFSQHTDIDYMRLNCSYSFLDTRYLDKELVLMNDLYIENSLICAIKKIFQDKMPLLHAKTNYLRLYEYVDCNEA